jgi:Cu+-exporting ATPase
MTKTLRILLASALGAVTAIAAETAPAANLKYNVKGMTCGACESKVSKALTGIDGVKVDKVCSKSGKAVVSYDSAKVKPEQVQEAITKSGFTVTSQEVSMKVGGMTCGACSKSVAKALKGVPGVTDAQVDHSAGTATVTVEPGKADAEKLKQAVTGAGFKVQS